MKSRFRKAMYARLTKNMDYQDFMDFAPIEYTCESSDEKDRRKEYYTRPEVQERKKEYDSKRRKERKKTKLNSKK